MNCVTQWALPDSNGRTSDYESATLAGDGAPAQTPTPTGASTTATHDASKNANEPRTLRQESRQGSDAALPGNATRAATFADLLAIRRRAVALRDAGTPGVLLLPTLNDEFAHVALGAPGVTRADALVGILHGTGVLAPFPRPLEVEVRTLAGRGVSQRFAEASEVVAAKARARREEMAALRRSGASLREIGTRYGITRQRVSQLVKLADAAQDGAA